MQGQLVWHIKVRRFGQADYEIAEIRMNGRRKPRKGEMINVGITKFSVDDIRVCERIFVKIDSFTDSTSGSRTKYTVLADRTRQQQFTRLSGSYRKRFRVVKEAARREGP